MESDENNKGNKISPTVSLPGYGKQYKSYLVKLLNENPILSRDRLTRVRQVQGQEATPRKNLISDDEKAITLLYYTILYTIILYYIIHYLTEIH